MKKRKERIEMGDLLYILKDTPYVIPAEDFEYRFVYVPIELFKQYKALNPNHANLKPYNYNAIRVWGENADIPEEDLWYDATLIMTSESNAPMMSAMFTKGLASDPDYMTQDEAEAVTYTTLGTFAYNNEIETFTEFSYFNNVTKLNEAQFNGCYNLSEIDIPAYVTEIGNGAFLDCASLTNIELPESVDKVGAQAFSMANHEEPQRTVSFAKCVGEIDFDSMAFDGCDTTYIYCCDIELTREEYEDVGAQDPKPAPAPVFDETFDENGVLDNALEKLMSYVDVSRSGHGARSSYISDLMTYIGADSSFHTGWGVEFEEETIPALTIWTNKWPEGVEGPSTYITLLQNETTYTGDTTKITPYSMVINGALPGMPNRRYVELYNYVDNLDVQSGMGGDPWTGTQTELETMLSTYLDAENDDVLYFEEETDEFDPEIITGASVTILLNWTEKPEYFDSTYPPYYGGALTIYLDKGADESTWVWRNYAQYASYDEVEYDNTPSKEYFHCQTNDEMPDVSPVIMRWIEHPVEMNAFKSKGITSDNELTMYEAEQCTNAQLGSFKNNTNIVDMRVLSYFTGITSLTSEMFSGCMNLTYVSIPPKVTSIPSKFTQSDMKLMELNGCENITSIGMLGLQNAIRLSYTYFPLVTSVARQAFTCSNPEIQNRYVYFGQSYNDITFSTDVVNNRGSFQGCTMTYIYCNGVEFTAEQYTSVGATRPVRPEPEPSPSFDETFDESGEINDCITGFRAMASNDVYQIGNTVSGYLQSTSYTMEYHTSASEYKPDIVTITTNGWPNGATYSAYNTYICIPASGGDLQNAVTNFANEGEYPNVSCNGPVPNCDNARFIAMYNYLQGLIDNEVTISQTDFEAAMANYLTNGHDSLDISIYDPSQDEGEGDPEATIEINFYVDSSIAVYENDSLTVTILAGYFDGDIIFSGTAIEQIFGGCPYYQYDTPDWWSEGQEG